MALVFNDLRGFKHQIIFNQSRNRNNSNSTAFRMYSTFKDIMEQAFSLLSHNTLHFHPCILCPIIRKCTFIGLPPRKAPLVNHSGP